jgi:hypothetical protein
MPEAAEGLADRIDRIPGVRPLLRDANAVWQARAAKALAEAAAEGDGDATNMGGAALVVTADWRSFEDAFPTFYQFTNRPR